MKRETESVIMSICAADTTIKKADMAAALSLLRGDKADAEKCDVPLTRAEAAKMLRVSRATVTAWGKRGIIRRMEIAGRRKALGFSRRSVVELLNGTKAGTDGEE